MPSSSLIRPIVVAFLTFCIGNRIIYAQVVHSPLPMQSKQITLPKVQSLVSISSAKPASTISRNIGAQAAMMAAVGAVKQPKLGYVGAALVGITTIMNNNDNDGRPATYTGGDGSNFAAGG